MQEGMKKEVLWYILPTAAFKASVIVRKKLIYLDV